VPIAVWEAPVQAKAAAAVAAAAAGKTVVDQWHGQHPEHLDHRQEEEPQVPDVQVRLPGGPDGPLQWHGSHRPRACFSCIPQWPDEAHPPLGDPENQMRPQWSDRSPSNVPV